MPENTSETTRKVKGISLRLLMALAIFAIILLVFLFITDEIVLEHETAFDNSVFQFLHSYTTTDVTNKMIFLTFFGSTKFLLPAYSLLVLYFLLFKKNTIRSFNIAAIGLGCDALLFIMKDIFKRHRPVHPLLPNVKGFSFPSGHSFSAFTFCGLLIYILWETKTNIFVKWIGSIVLFVFAALIATSRVYLHVHYASDVIAGFCLSVLWLTVCILVLHALEKKQRLKKNDVELETSTNNG
ncbi:phosphatase PAP2 family protein [Segetibacter koreensis]|uniref:phosphatase PAP2 family protein n=1 Tax=Segetibacter koreensis TaxID=398037 RepID=UPI00036D7191|nr:phosphatase PAP2 family protein [Segetibacter koreensis]